MKVAVEMGPGAMMYMPRFIKTGLGVQKLVGRNIQAQREDADRIRLLKESRKKIREEIFL
jgi:hypothetical protein